MPLRNRPAFFLLILVFLFSATTLCRGTSVPERPGNYVVDLAGIIQPAVETKINRLLEELEQKTTAQMAVLTVDSLQGRSIEEFSISIAHDKWKLGQKGKDNGILLVVAVEDRKYRIEVGYGLEAVLPDSLIGSIGRDFLVPFFSKGDYSTGIYKATLAVVQKIAANAGVTISGMPNAKIPYPSEGKEKSFGVFGKIASLLFFLVIFILFIRNPRLFLAYLLLSSMGGRRNHWGGTGGGFGGGFGGFSGGGGGFGGGGASGSW
jgi:uncharacterized protein